jgi:WD40 repeat protein
MAFSPSGEHLAAGDYNTALYIWNTQTGRVRTLRGHTEAVYDIAYTKDGTRLASACLDGSIKVWDALRESSTISISAEGLPYKLVMLSLGGRIALTGMGQSTAQFWNAQTGKPLGQPIKLDDRFVNWEFQADEKRALLFDANQNVRIVDLATGKEESQFKHDGPGDVNSALSPDGKWLVCTGPKDSLRLWDLEKRSALHTFPVLKDDPEFIFSPDGSHVAVGDRNGVVKIWDRATGHEVRAFTLNVQEIYSVHYSVDGKRLAVYCGKSGSGFTWDREVRILDTESGREISPPLKGILTDISPVFSPDGTRLAIGNSDGIVRLWDVTTGQVTLTLKGHTDGVTGLTFSPDGHRLISSSFDLTVRVWDATPLP